VSLLGFLESQESDLGAGKVANAFTQNLRRPWLT
jgi:hypothetical protein